MPGDEIVEYHRNARTRSEGKPLPSRKMYEGRGLRCVILRRQIDRVGVGRTRIESAGLQFVFRDRALRNSRLGKGIRLEKHKSPGHARPGQAKAWWQ